jgi:hypothetical protein
MVRRDYSKIAAPRHDTLGYVGTNRLATLPETLMPNKTVLLAGESWVSTATHIKGFDQFPTVTYHTGSDEFLRAMAGSG